MKICMLTSYFPPYMAGAELYVYEVSKYLVRQGHEVHVITKHFGNLPAFEKMDGINVHRVRALNIPKLRSFTAIPGLFLECLKITSKTEGFDIVHAHITYPNGVIAYLLKKLKKAPYIITSQGDELLDYPELKELKYIKPVLKIALKDASRVHCISTALEESLIKNFDVSPGKITIIPNGVDLNRFRYKKTTSLKERYNADHILINVSRLTSKNNVGTTLKAFKRVLKEFPNMKYIIVGDGEEREKLLDLTEELGIRQNVEFLGWTDHDTLPELLSGSDIFIRTSITEGLGIVFLEAMACGTPIIASNVQGIPDIVKEGYNGLLVDPMDVDETEEKIRFLLKKSEIREKFRENGLEFVKKFDWIFICEETEKMYNL